ncbi:MAG TPA: Clp protease N-terminal domain-containing protein [Acidimicrobiales bacterium]|nr:Clp protease N-terminal domain-containing protein [Acidimicrobiales bacterium]
MAKVNVYLPDDLEREVREAGLPLSPVCQAALRESLDRLAALRSRTVGLDRLLAHRGRGRFTTRLSRILVAAADDAADRGRQVTPHDLLAAILDHGDNLGAAALEAAGLDLPTPGFLRKGRSTARGEGELSPDARAVLALAFTTALELRHEHVGAEHVVVALATEPSPTAALFVTLGIDARTLRAHVERLLVRLLADR